jgi:hypothetical protein
VLKTTMGWFAWWFQRLKRLQEGVELLQLSHGCLLRALNFVCSRVCSQMLRFNKRRLMCASTVLCRRRIRGVELAVESGAGSLLYQQVRCPWCYLEGDVTEDTAKPAEGESSRLLMQIQSRIEGRKPRLPLPETGSLL